jgi:predicted PhzF superfamily epimerase YddE/YHI9
MVVVEDEVGVGDGQMRAVAVEKTHSFSAFLMDRVLSTFFLHSL